MIDLGRPALHGDGLTVFFDHADPSCFYYLPDRPRLCFLSDGTPDLTLLKYRLDPELHKVLGAGLLSFTVDLGVDEAVLSKMKRRISAQTGQSGPIQLGPVAAEAGSCELVLVDRKSNAAPAATGSQPAPVGSGAQPAAAATATQPADVTGFLLVEQILGGTTISLYGSNACTFSAVLSAEAVALIEGALMGGGLPAGVVYSLQTSGLRPALRAEISARWKDVYDYYDNRLHGGKLLLAVDIGPTIEDLVRSEAIRIKIDELVPDAERSSVYDGALNQVQQYILEQFFKPTLGQTPPPADDSEGGLQTIGKAIKDFAGVFAITYSLRTVDRNELKTFSYHLGASRAEHITFSPQGTLSMLLQDRAASARIVAVDSAPSAEMKFDVAPAIDIAAEQIDHIEVSLTYGNRRETLLLDTATPRRTASMFFEKDLGPEVEFGYEIQFRADSDGQTSKLSSASTRTANRVIRIDPRELYQRSTLRVVAKGIPFDRYPTVLVDLRLRDLVGGWSTSRTVELDATHADVPYSVRAGLNAKLRLERRLRYLNKQGTELVVDWDDAEPGVLIVGDPLPNIIDIQILGSARFGTEVRRIVVEVRPTDNPASVASFILTAENPSATWSRAAATAASRDYEYRVTVHTVRNEVRAGTWLPGTAGKLIVGEGIARLRQVQMMFIGAKLQAMDCLALKVRFSFEDPASGLFAEDEMLVEDTSKTIQWSYPVADAARQKYTYQLTAIKTDGSMKISDPIATADLLIIRPLPF
jgi:hypothetical protein